MKRRYEIITKISRDLAEEAFKSYAGKKDYNNSNILRAYLIQEAERQQVEKILSLEINIDDCSGETIGYTMKKFIFNI